MDLKNMTITNFEKDPIGHAVYDFSQGNAEENIIVHSNYCEDDVLPVSWLFRSHEMMPEVEQKALSLCCGTVLDVGAAAGCHSKYLKNKNIPVTAIDVSETCVAHLKSEGINAKSVDFFELEHQLYDTILMLMNGIGICGNLKRLPVLLKQAFERLNSSGQLLCDSTDVSYLFDENDGSKWVDLNATYYGDFKFQMEYKSTVGEWFDWLYVDAETLKIHAENTGFNVEIYKGETSEYLARLIKP